MPLALTKKGAQAKREYLSSLLDEVYMRDIFERYCALRSEVAVLTPEEMLSEMREFYISRKQWKSLERLDENVAVQKYNHAIDICLCA